MKKTKQLIMGLLLASIAAPLVSGCGSQQTQTKMQSLDKYVYDSSKVYDITWTSWLGSPVDEDAEMIKYWNEKLGVNIEIWNIDPGNYTEALGLKIAGGNVPDELWTPDVTTYYKYAKDGILAEISEDILKQCAPNLYEYYMSEEPMAFKYWSVNGKQYGIPAISSVGRTPMVYRGDWMKNVGVDKVPETLEEFEDLMYKFAKEDPDGNGVDDTYGLSNSGLDAVYGAYGLVKGYWLDRDGTLVYADIQPEMKEALALLNKWYQDGVLDVEFVMDEKQGSGSNMSKPFVTGRIGFTASGEDWHYKPILENSTEANDWEGDNVKEMRKLDPEGADSITFGLPVIGPYGKRGMKTGNKVGTESNTVAFGAQLNNEPDKLAKILNVIDTIGFSSLENYLTAENGIEGKHWEFNDKNQIVYLDSKYEQYTERAKIGAHTVMTPLKSLAWNTGTESYDNWIANGPRSKEYGIANALKTVLPSETRYRTELDKLASETFIAIITGDKPIDEFDKFVEDWKKMGGETLEKEANEWYASVK